jgi:hypothetical protein
MGEAYTAIEGGSQNLFVNPAGMARLNAFGSFAFGETRWIADIKHFYASAAFSPDGGAYGTIGVFAQSVDYGQLDQTIFAPVTLGYLDLGTFNPRGLVAGVGYARALNEQFSVGGVVKYVRQDLGSVQVNLAGDREGNVATGYAFDFGILYKTGFKSLSFGMTVRNFSKEMRYIKDGFQLPLTFKMGLAMDVLDLTDMDKDMHSLLVVVDAEHPRDYSEQIKFGAEYTFMKTLSLRIGYVTPADEHGVSYGVGIQRDLDMVALGLDYSYAPFGIFGGVHRFGIHFSL